MSGHRAKERRRTAGAVRLTTHQLTAAGLLTGALVPLAATAAFALPEGGTIAAGSATVSTPTATSMRIEQASDRLIMDWTRFNIAAQESVHFQQPSAAAIALNRVSGQEPSAIFGSLSATGQLFLLNPSGILFGATSRVDVGALTASTLAMTNQDFLNSQYRFTQDPSAANAAVVNQGLITAGPGGYVALLGAAAHNDGVIQAQLGSIALASGKAATLDLRGDGLIQFVLTDAVSGSVTGPNGTALSAVSNTGTLQADGGMVTLHAKSAAGLVRSVVNQEGVVRAISLINRGGVIKLIAEGDGGTITHNGTLDIAAATNATPGTITVQSDHAINLAGTVTAGAGAMALSAPEIQSTADISTAAVTLQATDLTLSGGSLTAATGTIDVAHAFTQTGGSVAPGAATITAGGNWIHTGGSFDPGTSTVVFHDASQSSEILGDNTFYDFTSVTPDKKLFFEAGATQTMLGAFTISGEKAHLIQLRSTDPGGGQWRLDPRGAVNVQFVHLGDAFNLSPTLIKALPSNSYGNNTGWDTDPIWNAVGPGNWSTDANWDTGVRPGIADTVTFNATSVTDSTVDVGFAGTITNLNINAGYTGTITMARSLTINTAFAQAAGTFNGGSSALTLSGTMTLTGGTFTSTSGTLTIPGNWTHTAGGTFQHNNGTVVVGGGPGSAWDVTGTETFNNLTVNKNGGNAVGIALGDTLIVGGTFTHTDGVINTGTIEAQGAVTIGALADGGTGLLTFGGTANQTYTQSGNAMDGLVTVNKASGTVTLASAVTWNAASQNLTVTSGTLDLAGLALSTGVLTVSASGTVLQGAGAITAGSISTAGTFTGGSAAITLTGSVTLTAGTFTSTSGTLTVNNNWTHTAGGTFTHNSGTVVASGATNPSWDVAGTETFNNFTVNKSIGYSVGIAAGDTLIVGGIFTYTAGYILGGTIQAQGAVLVGGPNAQGTNNWTGLIQITAAGDQTIEGNGGNLPNVRVSKPSGTLSLGTTNISVVGLQIDAGNTLSSTTGTLTVNDFTNTAGGIFTHNSGTVVAGYANHGFWDVAVTETFNNLTINKPGAWTHNITAGDTLIVEGTFLHSGGVSNIGTIQARGAVTIGASAAGGTTALTFGGTANQIYTQAGNAMDGLITVNKASGTVTLASAATWNAASQNLTVTSGTLDMAGFALSTGTLTLTAAGVVLQGAGAISAGSISTAGTFTGGNAAITLSGNLALTAGTFTSTGGTLTVAGTWTHTAGGTFQHNAGTVVVGSGTNNTWDVNVTETFNNLTVNKTGGFVLSIPAGDTFIAEGTFTHAAGVINTGTIVAQGAVTVGASAGGGTATVQVTSAGDQSIAGNGASLPSLRLSKPSGILSLGTTNLNLYSLTIDAGNTLSSTTGTLSIGANWTNTAGTFIHNSGTVVAIGGTNTAWNVNVTETFHHLTVSKNGGGWAHSIAAGDALVVEGIFTHTDGIINTGTIAAQGAVTIGALADGGSGLLSFTGTAPQTYTQSGNAMDGLVTVNKPSGTVMLTSAVTWNGAGQNLTVTSGVLDMAGFALSTGTLTVATAGTLQLQGAETITATAVALNAASTVRYYGTAAAYTLKNYAYSNLTIDGGAATVFSLPANLTTINTLTLTNSITSLAGFNMTAATLVNNATLRMRGNETVSITTMDIDSGLVEYVGDGAGGLSSFTIQDFGATDYYNLTIASSEGPTETFSLTAPLTVVGAFTHSAGTLTAGAGGIDLTAGSATISAPVIATAGGNILISSDTIDLAGGAGTISGTGTVTLQPGAAATTIGIAGGAGTLQLTTAALATLQDGFSGITIGRADGTGALIANAVSFTDPITLRSPGGAITVNALTGTDNASVTVISAATTINASVSTSDNPITIAASSGSITMFAGSLSSGAGDITLSGTGAIAGSYGIHLAAGAPTISTTSGNISLIGVGTVTLPGMRIANAGTVISTQTGSITLTGTGGPSAAGSNSYGIHLDTGAVIESTGTSIISLTGTGGTGINSDYGIRLQNGRISAVNGAIILTGTGNGTGTSGRGISVDSSSVVESTGNATVSLTGTGTLSGLDSYGVRITRGGIVRTVNGALTIMGTGGGSGTGNYGVGVDFSTGPAGLVRSTGAGTITIVGVGGTGTDNNGGIIVGDVSSITSVSGAVDLQGTGHGSGTGNYGIVLVAGAQVDSTGAAALTLTGTGAAGASGLAGTGALSTIGGALATGPITLTTDLIDLATITVQTSGAGAIDITTGGSLAVDQVLSANGTGAVTLTATGAITGLGGIISGGTLTLNASSVGTLATPLTLTALGGELSGTLSGSLLTDVFHVKSTGALTINLGLITATAGTIGHAVTIDSSFGSILHSGTGTDIAGGRVNFWGTTIGNVGTDIIVTTDNPPVYCNGTPCGAPYYVTDVNATYAELLSPNGVSQSGRYLLGATPEEGTLLTAGVLPDHIYRCLDQDRRTVVCTAGAVWHDDDGMSGVLSAEADPAQKGTHTIVNASVPASSSRNR